MLTTADIARLRRRLETLAAGTHRMDLNTERAADHADEAARLHDQDLAVTISDAAARRRREAREALQRMDRGEYGFCLRCEDPIPPKRLEARPEAPLCLVCAEREEQSMREQRDWGFAEVA